MAELAGKLAEIKVGGTPISAAGEVLERVSDTVWRVTDAAKRVLVEGVTVEWDDGGWVTVPYVSVNLLTGTFTFGGAGYGAGEDLRIEAGDYVPMATAAYAHSFTLSRGADLYPVTPFLATHVKRIAGPLSASGSLSQFDLTSTFFADTLVAGDPVVIGFHADGTAEPIRLWAMLDSVAVQAAIDGAQDEAVGFASNEYFL